MPLRMIFSTSLRTTINDQRRTRFAIHLSFAAIQQHINQLLFAQAHRTLALKVVALWTKAKDSYLAFWADNGQRAHSALRVHTGVQVIGDLAKGLGSISPTLAFELNELRAHAVTCCSHSSMIRCTIGSVRIEEGLSQ